MKNTALLLVDIQNDYFAGGKMPLENAGQAADRAAELAAAFRAGGMPVIHIQHISLRPGAAFFLPGTDGARIHDSVAPLEGEKVFSKHFPNSFRDTGLLEHLKAAGVQTLVVCGMMTHMCIDATVRAAFDHGLGCIVAADACTSRALEFDGRVIPADHVHASFLSALASVYARVEYAAKITARVTAPGP